MWQLLLELVGTAFGVVALLLYVRDKFHIEPVILRPISVRIMDNGRYLLQATLSNEGGRTAKNCSCGIEIDGNLIEPMAFVPVDSPIGRIGIDWREEIHFILYPHRPIPVRAWVDRPKNTRVSVILRHNAKAQDQETFALPDPDSIRVAER